MGRFVDLSGKRFGRLVVLHRVANKGKITRWRSVCDCGGEKTCQASALTTGATQSCGCLGKENARRLGLAKRKYQGSVDKERHARGNMIKRCYDQSSRNYHNYGGRGITVCDSWLASFRAFYEDVGPAPGREYTLDRICTDGNYEPGNVKWSTQDEQRHNMRRNRLVTFRGITQALNLWCRELGVSYKQAIHRLNCGCTPEIAFGLPEIELKDI